jgi:hypothetical protein
LQVDFSHRGKSAADALAAAASDLVVKASFFDAFCKDHTPLQPGETNESASFETALAAAPGACSRADIVQLVHRFESVIFPAIFYLPSDDAILLELLNIGLRHIDSMVVNHGFSTVLSVRRKLPEPVTKNSLCSCFFGFTQPPHLVDPWGPPETVAAIQSVSAEQWLPLLASLQFVADALVEVAETCAGGGGGLKGQTVHTFASVKLALRMQQGGAPSRNSFRATTVAGGGAGKAAGSHGPRGGSPVRHSAAASRGYGDIRGYDLATVVAVRDKQGVSVSERKLLESALLTLQNLHALARILLSKTLVYDYNAALYGRLLIQGDINLQAQLKTCVVGCLADMRRTLKGDSGCNGNLIVLLASVAHGDAQPSPIPPSLSS